MRRDVKENPFGPAALHVRAALAVAVLAALAAGGCGTASTTRRPILDYVRPVLGAEAGLDLMGFRVEDLDAAIQTTPVHPDDTGFLTGETTTELEDTDFSLGPKAGGYVGLRWQVGQVPFELKGGGTARLNTLAFEDGDREGLYEIRQQASDTRPPNQGSFVFTQALPDKLSLIPWVGLEAEILPELDLGFRVGFPRTKWEVRSGHDRFGDWETVQEDSWDDFGIRYDGTVAWRPGNEGALFFTGFYEEYDAEFDGSDAEFTGFGGFLGVRFSW